jgi:hypothetical protein
MRATLVPAVVGEPAASVEVPELERAVKRRRRAAEEYLS